MKKLFIIGLLLVTVAGIILTVPWLSHDSLALGQEPVVVLPPAEPMPEQEAGMINILLMGIDSGREKYEAIRSDAMMILTVDQKQGQLKLSSLMRDTYVEVPGKGSMKLNEAYAYGGPELALRAVNDNFQMNLSQYVTVDFVGLSNIIDFFGGVELDVKEKEIKEINKYMEEVAAIKKEQPTPLTKGGLQVLNGNQAVAYARIRAVGEGDFERSERQSRVLTALFQQLQEVSKSQYPSIAMKLLPYVTTNLSILDMIQTTLAVYSLGDFSLDWYRFPLYGYCEGKYVEGKWYLVTDLETTSNHLHQFIEEGVKVPPLKDSF